MAMVEERDRQQTRPVESKIEAKNETRPTVGERDTTYIRTLATIVGCANDDARYVVKVERRTSCTNA